MKRVVIALRGIVGRFNIPVLILHHTRKGGEAGSKDSVRGSGSTVNGARYVFTMNG